MGPCRLLKTIFAQFLGKYRVVSALFGKIERLTFTGTFDAFQHLVKSHSFKQICFPHRSEMGVLKSFPSNLNLPEIGSERYFFSWRESTRLFLKSQGRVPRTSEKNLFSGTSPSKKRRIPEGIRLCGMHEMGELAERPCEDQCSPAALSTATMSSRYMRARSSGDIVRARFALQTSMEIGRCLRSCTR